MLRYLGSYSRTILVSSSPSSSTVLLRLVRPVSNQTKTAPTSQKRQVNLKKLFSDEPSNETELPRTPRRPNILHSSSVDQSTQKRYEQDLANIDDYQSEENRRRTARSTENKATAGKRMNKPAKSIETDFDGTELVPPELEKIIGKQIRRTNTNETDLQRPKQPRRERSLTTSPEPIEVCKRSSMTRRRDALMFSQRILRLTDKLPLPCWRATLKQRLTLKIWWRSSINTSFPRSSPWVCRKCLRWLRQKTVMPFRSTLNWRVHVNEWKHWCLAL